MKSLTSTKELASTLSAIGALHMKWFENASFVTHRYMKSQTRHTMVMGKDSAVSNSSTKIEHNKFN